MSDTPPISGEWKRDGTVVYALNGKGFTRFYASVQAAYVSDGHRTPARDAEQIATLMQAAPELLEACNDAEAAIQWEDPYGETGISKEERLDECLQTLRAAIAKATGKATP